MNLLRIGLCALLACAVIGPVAAPASAQAAAQGTIVYIKDGDVIASTPDGSASHVVAGGGSWDTPAIADDGTVVAVRDDDHIVRMTQSGRVLSDFVPTDVFPGGIYDLEVSEDGEYVAYASITLCNRPDGTPDSCRNTEIVYADGRDPNPLGGAVQTHALTFLPGTPTVVVGGLDLLQPGDTETTDWFDRGLVDTADLDISRDGSLLAVAGCDYGATDGPLGCVPLVEFHAMTGAPPAVPQALPCFITNSEQVVSYDSVSFAPDADAVVFAERLQEEDLGQADVKVLQDFSADPCQGGEEIVLAEDATDPFWGAAAYDPDGGGTPEPPGPGNPADPEGTVRIDGGSTADPIGQAILASQVLFDDGVADRVVLATADRFPDALAGAALAGHRGPILLTPSGADLDPDVAAEIARVTGGEGVVLTLGGEAAVTQAAADQARAAGGDRACTAPLPTSCRFAGTGREDTAAQIAATVLAEHPDTDRVLLARGDAFADAITGGAYAAAAGVPVLLTPPTSLAAPTAALLEATPRVTEAVILGGEAAVSQEVAAGLPVTTVRRIAGADRTATSAAIATELWHPEGLGGAGVMLVNVRDEGGWQTALTAAVVAAAISTPQLGVESPPAGLSPAVTEAIGVVGAEQVIAFGGPDLVSADQLAAVIAAR